MVTNNSSSPYKRPRTRTAKPVTFWTQLNTPVVSALVVAVVMSIFTWVAFRATVLVRLDNLTEAVHDIQLHMMPKDEIGSDLHGITDRLGADEHNIDLIQKQLHDDEVSFLHHQ